MAWRGRPLPPQTGPYPPALLARRTALGLVALIGSFLILVSEVHSALTGTPHALMVLAFGVSLLLGSVIVAAVLNIVRSRRPS